jgi:hypothetical protein
MKTMTVRELKGLLAGYADEATVYVQRDGLTEPARSAQGSSRNWSVIISDQGTGTR